MKKYTQTYLHTHTLVWKNSGEASIQITPINKNSKKGFPHSQINKIALLSLLSLIICVSILVCVCVFMLVYKCCKTLTINLSFRKQVVNSVTFNNITVLLADNPIKETICLRLTCLCQYLIKSHTSVYSMETKRQSRGTVSDWRGSWTTFCQFERLTGWLHQQRASKHDRQFNRLICWLDWPTNRSLTQSWLADVTSVGGWPQQVVGKLMLMRG